MKASIIQKRPTCLLGKVALGRRNIEFLNASANHFTIFLRYAVIS